MSGGASRAVGGVLGVTAAALVGALLLAGPLAAEPSAPPEAPVPPEALAPSEPSAVPSGPALAGTIVPEPVALFASAFTAYTEGDVAAALERYREAAALGHLPASWKLARMYEGGEGVARSPALAFETYRGIARRYGTIRPGEREAVYVASAFVRLGDYARAGTKGVPADPVAARRAYFYAASYFGDADAQYALGRMMLEGEGGAANARLALRWLNAAAGKGHVRAGALLGASLFEGRGIEARPVRGLAMLLEAAREAREPDREWVGALRDGALARASASVSRAAREMAGEGADAPEGAS